MDFGKQIYIAITLLLFTMPTIAGDHKVWVSKDRQLEIRGNLIANPMADEAISIRLIAVGLPASFLHIGNKHEVKGNAHLILYYPATQRLELHDTAHLKQDNNNYYGERVIYDLKSQHIVKPKKDKHFFKPLGIVEPNTKNQPTRHRCAVHLGCV